MNLGKRKKTSTAQDHFSEIPGDTNFAKFFNCNAKISCAAANGNNAMKRHIMRCKKTLILLTKGKQFQILSLKQE